MCKTSKEYFEQLYKRFNFTEDGFPKDPDIDIKRMLCKKIKDYCLKNRIEGKTLCALWDETPEIVNDILLDEPYYFSVDYLQKRYEQLIQKS